MAAAKQDRQRGKGTVEKLRNEFSQLRAAAAERERALHAQELAASRKMERKLKQRGKGQVTASRNDSPSMTSSTPTARERASYSPPSPRRSPSRPQLSSSTSTTSEGHLVRLLDERAAAAAHNTSKRAADHQGLSKSSSDSSTQQQYYKNHHYPQQQPPPQHGNRSFPSPMRRDARAPQSQAIPTFPSRSGGNYSLDQYSHDASDTNSRYTDSSSYSENEQGGRGRSALDPPPPVPTHHPWNIQDYPNGSNALQYVNESSYESNG